MGPVSISTKCRPNPSNLSSRPTAGLHRPPIRATAAVCRRGPHSVAGRGSKRPETDNCFVWIFVIQNTKHQVDPKRFAASLRLDHNSLYEEGALEATRNGNHLRALELYMLAKSPYLKRHSPGISSESVTIRLVDDGRPAPAALPGDCCGLPSPTRSPDGSKRPVTDPF